MTTNLERRLDALESQSKDNRSAAEMSDRELLAIIAPDYTGPMPPDDEVQAMIDACVNGSPTVEGDHGKP